MSTEECIKGIFIILFIAIALFSLFLGWCILDKTLKYNNANEEKQLKEQIEKLNKDLRNLDRALIVSNDYIRFLELERKLKKEKKYNV